MECKKCGRITVDGATFCGYCGARVDGRKPCKSCGNLNEEDFLFCVHCGEPMDNKTLCGNCGVPYEGNFCPACGTAAKKVKPQEKKAARKGCWANICDIIGGAFTMLGVLAALIFVFFIGVEAVGEYSGLSLSQADKTNIFYFFGEYQKDFRQITSGNLELTQWFANLIDDQVKLYGAIGMVVAIVTLVAVVTFATLAAVKYVLGWVKKTEKKTNGWALATVVSFLLGSVLFYSVLNMRAELYSSTEVVSAFLKFNGATVAGIIICAIALVIATILQIIAKGKAFWTGKKVISFVFSAISLAFAGVLLGLAQYAGFGFEYAEYGQGNMSINCGYLSFNLVLDIALGSSASSFADTYYEVTCNLHKLNVWNICGQIACILVALFAGVALVFSLRGLTSEKKNCGLAWAICLLITAIFLLVCTLLAHNAMELILIDLAADLTESPLDYKVGVSITAVVFSALLLAAEIVHSAIGKEKATVWEVL